MKISIIIPCFNSQKYLPRLFNSLVNQSIGLNELEMIFVNDCSTDNTYNKLIEFESKHPNNIIVINLHKNLGAGNARNIAMEYATCNYVSFIDSDDWIELDIYEKVLNIFAQYDCDMVMYGFDQPSSEDNIKSKDIKKEDVYYTIEDNHQQKLLINNFGYNIIACNKVFKREFLNSIKIKFPVYGESGHWLKFEDHYWGFLIWLQVKNVYVINEPLYHYWRNDLNSTTLNPDTNQFDQVEIQLLLLEECKKKGLYNTYKDEIDYNFYERAFLIPVCHYLTKKYRSNDLYVLNIINKMKDILLKKIPDIRDNPYYKYEYKRVNFFDEVAYNEIIFKLLLDNNITLEFLDQFVIVLATGMLNSKKLD